MKFYDCSYCGAIGRMAAGGKPPDPPLGHSHRDNGTLRCPQAVSKNDLNEAFSVIWKKG